MTGIAISDKKIFPYACFFAFLFLFFLEITLPAFEPGCHQPLGMQSGSISDESIRASSSQDRYHGPYRARLHLKKEGILSSAWSAKYNDRKQWIIVNLGSLFTITRIATQGRNDKDQWVKSYRMDYSKYGLSWIHYVEDGRVRVRPHAFNVWYITLENK